MLLSLKSLRTSHTLASLPSLSHPCRFLPSLSCLARSSSRSLSSSSLSFRMCGSSSRVTPVVVTLSDGSILPPGMMGGIVDHNDCASDGRAGVGGLNFDGGGVACGAEGVEYRGPVGMLGLGAG